MQLRANANPHIVCKCQLTLQFAHLRCAALEEPVSPGRRLDARALVHQVATNPCAVCIVQCALFSVHSALCSVQCAVCIVHCALCTARILQSM